MKEQLTELFQHYPYAAFFISILVSIIIAVLGVVPSFFITAANILSFGFVMGTLVSFLGESIGAMAAFILYRKGFKKKLGDAVQKFSGVKKLLEAEKREAFGLILSLRLIPFVPSGLITFAAAVGTVPSLTFFCASSLGKIPALFCEAGSVYAVTKFSWPAKILLMTIALLFLFAVAKRIISRGKTE